jgi:hypothetical protein
MPEFAIGAEVSRCFRSKRGTQIGLARQARGKCGVGKSDQENFQGYDFIRIQRE